MGVQIVRLSNERVSKRIIPAVPTVKVRGAELSEDGRTALRFAYIKGFGSGVAQ